MMRWFTHYVIGGETGKRESAWFAFFLWLAFSVWLGYAAYTSPERDLAVLTTMWATLTPFVLAWLGTAHGLDWASRQSGIKKIGNQEPYDAG